MDAITPLTDEPGMTLRQTAVVGAGAIRYTRPLMVTSGVAVAGTAESLGAGCGLAGESGVRCTDGTSGTAVGGRAVPAWQADANKSTRDGTIQDRFITTA